MNQVSKPQNRFYWFIQLPLIRIILAIIWISLPVTAAQLLLKQIPGIDPDILSLISAVIVIIVSYFSYVSFVKVIERRKANELGLKKAIPELSRGIAIGVLLFSITIGFLWLFNFYTVTGVNDWLLVIPIFSVSLIAGFVEEIFFRGIIFRITEESLGTWISLAISALLFGLLHIFNPNATLFAALAIALEAGILLGAAYLFTRRLWLAIGIHFAWNFTQGGIFGVAVSGHKSSGLLEAQLTGDAIWSGGEFGVEASIFAIIVATAAGIYFLWQAYNKKNFIKPFWRR